MSKYQAFELEDLQADRSRSYAEFLRRPGISMGIYHLPAGGKDLQHPHSADEVYVVLAGRAVLEVEGERARRAAREGRVGRRRCRPPLRRRHRGPPVLVVFAPPDDPGASHE